MVWAHTEHSLSWQWIQGQGCECHGTAWTLGVALCPQGTAWTLRVALYPHIPPPPSPGRQNTHHKTEFAWDGGSLERTNELKQNKQKRTKLTHISPECTAPATGRTWLPLASSQSCSSFPQHFPLSSLWASTGGCEISCETLAFGLLFVPTGNVCSLLTLSQSTQST